MKTAWHQKLRQLGCTEILLWLEAVFLLGVARFLVWALPFKYWVKLIGQPMSTSLVYDQVKMSNQARLRIAWAVKSAAYRVPWQAVCLPQAMAAKWMLGFRGQSSKLYLGVKSDPQNKGKLAAHAWLECAEQYITGGGPQECKNVSHFI
jgi:hypothetical protein